MKTLKRSKLKYKLRKIGELPVTMVSAPSGFGKTTTLHSYLEGKNVKSIWFSMYAQKDEQWAWNKLLHLLHQEYEGMNVSATIPSTLNAMENFIEEIQPHITTPLFIVLDDVTFEDIPNIMKALSIYSYKGIPFLHMVIITKDTLDNLAPYEFSNTILQLNTIDLAFTKDEIRHLCTLEQIHLSEDELDNIYMYTNGWILAITLLLDSYKTYQHLHYQVDINNLMQCVFFEKKAFDIQNDLIKLSVLKAFTFDFAYKICDSKQTLQVLLQLEKENHLIQTINHKTYQFIPIFKEFLTKKLFTSNIDIDSYTKSVAQYYLEEDEPLEAIEMLLSIRDFGSIVDIFNQYSAINFADTAPNLIMKVFQKLPDHFKNEYPSMYLKWITDCMTNFPQIDGVALLEDFKDRIDHHCIQENKDQLYGEYYFIHAFTYFNDIEKMMQDFKTAYQYFNGKHSNFVYPFMITSFGSCHMLFLYYNRIGYLQETMQFIEENTHYFMSITNGIHAGSINLVKAEYYYEIGEYKQVAIHAELGYQEAMENNQLSGAICCLFVLGRLALMEHEISFFKQIEERLINFYKQTDVPILHKEIDCALGYLYILNDDIHKVKSWLKDGDFSSIYLLPEGRMMAHIIHGVCLIKERKFNKLRHVCNFIKETNKTLYFAYADIFSSLFEMIYTYRVSKVQEALGLLNKSIALCKKDSLISPMVELSFAFDQLFKRFIPSDNFSEKMVSAVAKHVENNAGHASAFELLTPKEKEVLELCSHGKKVREIAEMKLVSINTVQSHMKSIYKKLSISTKLEAIQYYKDNFE